MKYEQILLFRFALALQNRTTGLPGFIQIETAGDTSSAIKKSIILTGNTKKQSALSLLFGEILTELLYLC